MWKYRNTHTGFQAPAVFHQTRICFGYGSGLDHADPCQTRVPPYVLLLFGMFIVCPCLKLEWDSLLSFPQLSECFNTSHRFSCFHFHVCIILTSLLVFQNSFGVISEPLHHVGRSLTLSDFLDFPHRRGSWQLHDSWLAVQHSSLSFTEKNVNLLMHSHLLLCILSVYIWRVGPCINLFTYALKQCMSRCPSKRGCCIHTISFMCDLQSGMRLIGLHKPPCFVT